jgi:type IV secretory pathway VirB4 component
MPETSTQQFLEIEDIREGVLILKDKSLRGILVVSSLNFALKSEEEQNAIIYQFQNFLNSLDFPIQIYIQSRKLNITGYLEKLKELEEKQKDKLLKIQTREYRNFIESLLAKGSIMAKNFYVIIPFYPLQITPGKIKKEPKTPALSNEQFERAKTQLWQRVEFVAHGLRSCGLFCAPLSTEELIELFWSIYHPQEAEVGYYPEIPPELIK